MDGRVDWVRAIAVPSGVFIVFLRLAVPAFSLNMLEQE